jgi:hypothetical protein
MRRQQGRGRGTRVLPDTSVAQKHMRRGLCQAHL